MPELASTNYWSLSGEELLDELESSRKGLTSAEAERRLTRFGRNALNASRRAGAFALLLRQFTSPLVLILLFAVVISMFVGEWTDAIIILTIVIGTAVVSFIQEYSAGNAVARLRAKLRHEESVLRDGRPVDLHVEEIVPGDIVMLSAGSLIPADGVLLESNGCFVIQAVLTGETYPVEKAAGIAPSDATVIDRNNSLFMGTSVRSGTASMLVARTATSTEFGKIAEQLGRRVPETEFERGIRRFGLMLTRIMAALVLVVFAFNVITEKPPIDSLLFAIALAVGISPELLPAIITINLSKAARSMARRGVIVRRLNAIENLGSMDVLCSDKTGTLTEGAVRLDAALNAKGEGSDEVMRLAFFNASLQSGLANPLDEAIFAASGKGDADAAAVKIGEIPYDFSRKRLSVAVELADGPLLICKGALDRVLEVCSRLRDTSETRELTAETRKMLAADLERFSSQGFRVLGLATRKLDGDKSITRESESGLVFEGFLLFFDPPVEGAREAIKDLARMHVGLKIISGDNRHIVAHVAEQVGFPARTVLTGGEIALMNDDALGHAAGHTDLFAEVDPGQKERVIRALQKRGHVVGYLGDGINDAPSLQDADVGISVDTAVDVAREAADLVLLKKGLEILRYGIVEGRTTFANSVKYIFTTTSANFGNMFSMAAISGFLPFLPLLAKQVLLNNFLSDIPGLAIAGDRVDRFAIVRPHRWNIKVIRDFMIVFGLVSSVFDILTFGVLIYAVRASPDEFRTGWFIESLLTEIVIALVVRTRLPFYKSRPGNGLLISSIVVGVFAVTIPYLPFVDVFGFVPLPLSVMLLILGITAAYVAATEVVKRHFYRRMEVWA